MKIKSALDLTHTASSMAKTNKEEIDLNEMKKRGKLDALIKVKIIL